MSNKAVVLYADDDADDLQLLQEAFSHYSRDLKLVTVTDGIKALSYLENLKQTDPTPCLIILDINMPRLNGKETLRSLRQIDRYEDVPVILFTTSSQQLDKDFAGKYNAGFLTKPINHSQLERIANTFLEHCTDEVKRKLKSNIN